MTPRMIVPIRARCAHAAMGPAAAALPRSAMNSRSLMASPAPRTTSGMKRKYHILDRELCRSLHLSRQPHVRFGSKADIQRSLTNVRFTPNRRPDAIGRTRTKFSPFHRSFLFMVLRALPISSGIFPDQKQNAGLISKNDLGQRSEICLCVTAGRELEET